jgi:hypothetical protein
MAATSKHYGDVYKWLEKVIDSCTTPLQESSARRLIRLFREGLRRSGEVDRDTIHFMESVLRYRLEEKTYSRIEKKLENGN